MNLIKELKIDIENCLQFIITNCKRGFMFALSLSAVIVISVLPRFVEMNYSWMNMALFISLIICLTSLFLYIMDAFKLAWRFYRSKQREKAKQERLKDDKNRVTVALLK